MKKLATAITGILLMSACDAAIPQNNDDIVNHVGEYCGARAAFTQIAYGEAMKGEHPTKTLNLLTYYSYEKGIEITSNEMVDLVTVGYHIAETHPGFDEQVIGDVIITQCVEQRWWAR